MMAQDGVRLSGQGSPGHLPTPQSRPHPPNEGVFGACVDSFETGCSSEMACSSIRNLHRSFLSLLAGAENRCRRARQPREMAQGTMTDLGYSLPLKSQGSAPQWTTFLTLAQ